MVFDWRVRKSRTNDLTPSPRHSTYETAKPHGDEPRTPSDVAFIKVQLINHYSTEADLSHIKVKYCQVTFNRYKPTVFPQIRVDSVTRFVYIASSLGLFSNDSTSITLVHPTQTDGQLLLVFRDFGEASIRCSVSNQNKPRPTC